MPILVGTAGLPPLSMQLLERCSDGDLNFAWFVNVLEALTKYRSAFERVDFRATDVRKIKSEISKDRLIEVVDPLNCDDLPAFSTRTDAINVDALQAVYHAIRDDTALATNTVYLGFAMLTGPLFKLSTAIMQHLCARLEHGFNAIVTKVLRDGIYVFYRYYFYYLLTTSNHEEAILRHVAQSGLAHIDIKSRDRVLAAYAESQRRHLTQKQERLLQDIQDLDEDLAEITASGSANRQKEYAMLLEQYGETHLRLTELEQEMVGLATRESALMDDWQRDFRQRHGWDATLPSFFVEMPWRYATTTMNTRSIFLFFDGHLYLDYTHMAEWMVDQWCRAVDEWRDWDRVNIVDPYMTEFRRYYQGKLLTPGVYQSHVVKAFEEEHLLMPLRRMMEMDLFLSYANTQRAASTSVTLADQAICRAYTIIFNRGHLMTPPRSSNNNTYSSSLTAATAVTADELTGNLFIDYNNIMPPCILKMHATHINEKTHFKFQERLRWFSWCYKAKIPYEAVAKEWERMIIEDKTKPSAQTLATLRNDFQSLWRQAQENEDSGQFRGYFACTKMTEQCPFVEIEDLADRKMSCCQSLCVDKPPALASYWESNFDSMRWSPLSATFKLINYYSKKNSATN